MGQVRMKVIRSRSRSQKQKRSKIPIPTICNNFGSTKHRAVKFACSLGFSAMADRMVWSSSLSRDRKWPRVTECAHSWVVGLKLESNLVAILYAKGYVNEVRAIQVPSCAFRLLHLSDVNEAVNVKSTAITYTQHTALPIGSCSSYYTSYVFT